jgi:putative salt-induced outer membrane protein
VPLCLGLLTLPAHAQDATTSGANQTPPGAEPPRTVTLRIVLEEAPPPPTLSGELGASFSMSRTGSTSRRYAVNGDLLWRQPGTEVSTELRVDRELVRDTGGTTTLDNDEFDVSVKGRRFFDFSNWYVWVSPRLRYDRFAYYRSSQALRAGVGHLMWLGDEASLYLEAGPGTRRVRQPDDSLTSEGLFTLAARLEAELSPTLNIKFNAVNERSGKENYRTVTASLRSRLSQRVWLKYEASYRKALPFDAPVSTSETTLDAGISYRF